MIRAQSTLCCILKFAVTIKNLSINRRLRAQRERERALRIIAHTRSLSLSLALSLADSHIHTHTLWRESALCIIPLSQPELDPWSEGGPERSSCTCWRRAR